ncbi:MAG: sulfite exporter TauE/SafE family protein [Sediminibacterium sp.]|nr:sulfite exporter TauE/SafE family protein [Sediminibacterium sp.]MBX9778925.1 sulfite exporter TauE/SafE family protein [Chitinophagaceae bacterium]
MEIVGYFLSLLVGVSLGLIGGGGSILTIPVLVYLFNIDPFVATGYSLFIVGISSLAGAAIKYTQKQVDLQATLYFGLTSVITVLLVRHKLLPLVPEEFFTIKKTVFTKSLMTLVLFSIVMIIAATHMIRRDIAPGKLENSPFPIRKALIRGLEVGALTGLLGAGGGFVIIPVLIFSFKLPMKKAIGTSLFIIAINSLFGFLGDLFTHQYNWSLLMRISSISCVGIFVGNALSNKIGANNLKKGFGYFVLAVGTYILLHETLKPR